MATRLYLTTTAIPYTPATIRGAWDATGTPSTGKLAFSPSGSNTAITKSETSSTNNYDILFGRWVSDPLTDDQTIAGTLDFSIRASEANADANAFLHLHIYVTAGDSDTVRGTLLTDYIGAAELTTTLRGTTESGVSLTSVDAQTGDRIVLVLGAQLQNTHTTARTINISYAGVAVPDLAGTNTTAGRPKWIEFSGNIPFAAKLATVTDNFNDNSFDTGKFTNWGGGNVVETNQRIEITGSTNDGDYFGFDTISVVDATDTNGTIELVDKGADHADRVVTFLQIQSGSADCAYYWEYNNAVLRCWKNIHDVYTQVGSDLAYNSAVHKFFRWREASGTVYWDWSTIGDGSDWTNHTSASVEFALATALPSVALVGNEGVPASASFAYFDNFNIPGVSPNKTYLFFF